MAFKAKYNIPAVIAAMIMGIPVVNADMLDDGRQAFMNYDFERAAELYDKYVQTLRKKPNPQAEELLDLYRLQLELAENSLDNVQKIEVIDRVDVPVEGFFNAVRLPQTGGKLLAPDKTPVKDADNSSDFVFSNESGDFKMWSETDADGVAHIMESTRLTDGSWETPVASGDILNDGGDVRNPFMLTDGVTLYYAGDGDGSMGGYDIFVATKDPVSGDYRQPVGAGYPFNSPYNEYLMAIDENNGIGWWVTDRNGLDGQVSVYVFRTNEIRQNYVAEEEENIVSLARLDDITLTQNPDTDYKAMVAGIMQRGKHIITEDEADFLFPIPGGRVYKTLDDFSSAKAKRTMMQYLKAEEEHNSELNELLDLRRRYHKANKKSGASTAIANRIKDLEKQTEWQRNKLKKMRNAVISAELKGN